MSMLFAAGTDSCAAVKTCGISAEEVMQCVCRLQLRWQVTRCTVRSITTPPSPAEWCPMHCRRRRGMSGSGFREWRSLLRRSHMRDQIKKNFRRRPPSTSFTVYHRASLQRRILSQGLHELQQNKSCFSLFCLILFHRTCAGALSYKRQRCLADASYQNRVRMS